MRRILSTDDSKMFGRITTLAGSLYGYSQYAQRSEEDRTLLATAAPLYKLSAAVTPLWLAHAYMHGRTHVPLSAGQAVISGLIGVGLYTFMGYQLGTLAGIALEAPMR